MRFSGGLVVRRRARRDILLLVGWTSLVAFAALLAIVTPWLLVDTVDTGARAAVANAGESSEVIVSSAIGKPSAALAVATPQTFLDIGDTIQSRLPPALRATYSSSILSAVGPSASVKKLDAKPAHGVGLHMGILTPAQLGRIVLVSGKFPPSSSTRGIVVSTAAAKNAGLKVGTVIHLAPPSSFGGAGTSSYALTVEAIVKPKNASEPLWRDLTGIWSPSGGLITVLAPPKVVLASADSFNGPLQGSIRILLDPKKFTAGLEQKASAEITELRANDHSLAADTGAPLSTQSTFAQALAGFPPEARASTAQMALMIAGMLGVAGAVILLLARLLISRRENELALERARGSSVVDIGVRALVEAALVAIIAGIVALGIAGLVLPDILTAVLQDPVPLVAVLAIAVCAPVVQSITIARAAWRGKREPANRAARQEIVKRARTRRLVIEGAVVVIAFAALYSLRTRGLLETRTAGVDPLLAAAPLLLAVVITLVVLRIYPFVARGAGKLGQRSRGALGVLGAMQVQRAIAILPLLALTLAVALAVGGGLLIGTVRQGQIDASWQRIGADVRVKTAVTAADVAKVAAEPGVTAAASDNVLIQQSLTGGTTSVNVSVIGMDRNYAKVVAQLPENAGGGTAAAKVLRRVEKATRAAAFLPIVVDREAYRQLASKHLTLSYGTKNIPVKVVGYVDRGPLGYLTGPFVFADLNSISARVDKPVGATSLMVVGPDAVQATRTLHHVAKDEVLTRASWVSQQEHRALVSGVNRIMTLAAASVALLAIIALLATVLASAPTRARALALLRTLGMHSRLGWWLALAELAPVVIAALIGGVVAGVGIVELLTPSLGIGKLTGGLDAPKPSLSPTVVLGVAVAAFVLLGLAMLAEVISHRRDRLSDVLRVGDSG
jgi:putative ABC transport system permease protein